MHIYLRGDTFQKLRLISGLVLFVFAGTHFLNHAFGLVSLELMHGAQDLRTAVTRSVPGTIVLALALFTHMTLGLYKTARRRILRMPPWELAQIITGIAIPFLLLPHIVNTRIAHSIFGVDDIYLYELKRLWPDSAWQQSALLLLVWGHGCIGLHHWLRLSERYKGARPLLGIVAAAVPVLALAGFIVAGRTTADIMSDANALAALKERAHWPDSAASAALALWRDGVRIAFGMAVLLVAFVVIWRRRQYKEERSGLRITYSGGPTVAFEPGQTLLEVSRAAGVRHASVCGGRARCSTCRVRIERGLDSLPPPEGAEAATLKAIDAPANVRLACQVRPSQSLEISLVSAPGTPGPVQLEFNEVKWVVAAHARAQLIGQYVDAAATDPNALVNWFQQQLGQQSPMLDSDAAVARLRGGRIDFIGSHRIAVAVYECDGEFISVFVTPREDAAPYMVRARRNGYRVFGWSDERTRYVAVTSSSTIDLERFQSATGGSPSLLQTAEAT